MKRKIIVASTLATALLCAAWLHGASSADDGYRALEQRIADLERRVTMLENPEPRFLPVGPEDKRRTP